MKLFAEWKFFIVIFYLLNINVLFILPQIQIYHEGLNASHFNVSFATNLMVSLRIMNKTKNGFWKTCTRNLLSHSFVHHHKFNFDIKKLQIIVTINLYLHILNIIYILLKCRNPVPSNLVWPVFSFIYSLHI